MLFLSSPSWCDASVGFQRPQLIEWLSSVKTHCKEAGHVSLSHCIFILFGFREKNFKMNEK